MSRAYLIITIVFFCCTCKSKSQSKINVTQSLKLFKEGSSLMLKGIKVEYKDSLSAVEFYKQAKNKFLESYSADTTNLKLGLYLDLVYSKELKFDSALFWAFRKLMVDSMYSIDQANTYHQTSLESSWEDIGFYYLYLGNLVIARKYFEKAKIQPSDSIWFIQQLSSIADRIYFNEIIRRDLASKNINPCLYSVEIMKLGIAMSKNEEGKYYFSPTRIKQRESNCK
jgi:hypothetical protein